MIIVYAADNCTSCLRCELACSYHHVKAFSRSHSSIKVVTFLHDAAGKVRVEIMRRGSNIRPSCDDCSLEKSPLCVRFCPEGVLKIKGKP